MKLFKTFLITFILFSATGLFSQSGMTFSELASRLSPYFDRALIMDIEKQLPQGSDYKIWGWDVGDFSGDGYNDLGLSVKLAAEKKKIVETYLFVDIEGYLVKVGNFSYPFIEIPLEIGVVINKNTCFVTKKNKKYHWDIQGFSFDNGVLVQKDEFTTAKMDNLTLETYRDFVDLRNSIKFLHTQSGENVFFRDYLSILSYPRGRIIYKGFTNETQAHFIDFVPVGAYEWNGKDDASIKIRSAHDEEYLYMTLDITDDNVVTQNCDTCITDHVEIWLDVNKPNPVGGRFYSITDDGQVNYNTSSDKGIYLIKVFPGNFLKRSPYVKISTNENLQDIQKEASKRIKAVADLTPAGYELKFKIPFVFLGFNANPTIDEDFFKLGCTVKAIDYDNEFRPEEKTEIATSDFESSDPTTFGELIFIPHNKWYGAANNIFRQDIINNLIEYGY